MAAFDILRPKHLGLHQSGTEAEASWIHLLSQHQVLVAVCGATLAQFATCAFLHIHYSIVGRYPDRPPAWAIYESIIKHHANLQNIGCVMFYIGADMICLSLLPELKNPSHAFVFFVGVLGICFFVAIGFGHISPHVCRMIHGHPAVEATEFRGDTIFLDFTVPLSEMCFKAVAQISCFIVYILGLYRALVFSSHDISLTYWAISIVAVQFYLFNADPQTSRRCYISSAHLIEAIISHLRGYTCSVKSGEDEWICPSRPNMVLRGFLHFLVNGLGFLLIWLTVPVLVAYSDSPLDYIMNLFAVTFLTQLDDVSEEKMFLIRFDAIGGNCLSEHRNGFLSSGGPCSPDVEAQSDIQCRLMELSCTTEEGNENAETESTSRNSALEMEVLDLKHRLAELEAKMRS